MRPIRRFLSHCWRDAGDAERTVGRAALDAIEAAVRQSELAHSGEIRVCIEAGLPMAELWAGTTPRARAVAQFAELGVWDTEANNGVLIYVLLADHAIEIVADRGVCQRVAPAAWEQIASQMSQAFAARDYGGGVLKAIATVDALLREHFANAPGSHNPNELPDHAVLR